MKINGKEHRTISEAAPLLGVSVKTIRQWIEKNIIPKPQKVEYGTRDIEVFPDEYIEEAKRAKAAYKEKKKLQKRSKHSGKEN